MPDTMEERADHKFRTSQAGAVHNGYLLNIRTVDLLAFIRQEKALSFKEGRASMAEEVKNYQYGFIRQGEDGELERAPEWQVIEDLLNVINQLEKDENI